MNGTNTNHAARQTKNPNALTKRDLVVAIALETNLNQLDVHRVVQRTLDRIIDALQAGKHVEFREFGVFQVTTRKSRIGRNPNKPTDIVHIPPRRVVKFKPGRRMKQIMQDAGPEA